MPSRLIEASDPMDTINSLLLLLSPIQTRALHKAAAASHSSFLPPAPRAELAGASSSPGLQDQLEEVEAAVVSPVCTGDRFRGPEKGAGWVAVTGEESGQEESK